MTDKKEHSHKEHKDHEKKEKEAEAIEIAVSGKVLAVAGIILALIVGFVIGKYYASPGSTDSSALTPTISPDEAGTIAKNTLLAYMVEYYKSMGMDVDPSSLNIEVTKVEKNDGGFYEVYLKIGGREYPEPIYVTFDGKSVFFGRRDAVKSYKVPEVNITKSEKPNVSINVMSFCPYGNQAENALKEVIDLLGDKVNFVPHYIIYKGENPYNEEDGVEINGEKYWSLHGNPELYQDIREKIVYDLYGAKKWIEYVVKVNEMCNTENIDTCWKDAAVAVGIDPNVIEQEMNKSFEKYVIEEYEATAAQGISGSPTILINDYTYKKARTPEMFKQAICDAFLQPPEECGSELSSDEEAVQGSCG
ncbi:MAG: hypothetical protein GXN99_02955 [Candidatus Nanohaloarchaeota archaeon]|nr:hypothetical protein [Candidatus Nanohaloarchaeota archaeon]